MKKYQKILAAVLALCAVAPGAKAASYQLNDYSVTNLGRSYAGVGVVGDDYSAIAYNPAGMTLKKKSGLQQVVNVIGVKSKVEELGTGNEGSMKFWQPMPAGFGQYNVNDRLVVGGGIYAPFGLKTKYKADWFGNQSAILSKLAIVDFNVSAAYKLDEHWSIGASAILRYIYGRMTQKAPALMGNADINFNVHGYAQTGTLGLMYEFNKDSRVGVSYHLRSAQRANGLIKVGSPVNATGDVHANPDLPEYVVISGYHRINDFGLSASARWTHWTSSFPAFTIRNTLTGESKSNYDYQNTWGLAFGTDYYYDENITLRGGLGYDESPTHKPERRTYRIPDGDRYWISAGASYVWRNWQFDGAYAYLRARTAYASKDAGATPGGDVVSAKFKGTHSSIFGLQAQYSF